MKSFNEKLLDKAVDDIEKTLKEKKETVEMIYAEDVAESFNEFLTYYEQFRKSHYLKDNDLTAFEICTALLDKCGRIARQVKHAERGDHKEDWPQGMTEAICGFIVYSIFLLKHYNVDINDGFCKELQSSIVQYSCKKKGAK